MTQDWFDEPRYHMLGSAKRVFLLDKETIELSPVFEDFRPWLQAIQRSFSRGFKAKPGGSSDEVEPEWMDDMSSGDEAGPAVVPFDDATLGGRIKYSTILKPVRHLKGALHGLIIRDPHSPPLLVPAPSSSLGRLKSIVRLFFTGTTTAPP
jgi:hypothetical protein